MPEIITVQDAQFALKLVKKICAEVGPGLPGSSKERERAEIIKKELETHLGAENVAVEEFTLAPGAFLGSLPLSALLMFMAALLNISAGHSEGIKPWLLVTMALGFSVSAFLSFFFEYIKYFEFVDPLFRKAQSENVIGVLQKPGSKKVERLLILSGHHDSALENTWIGLLGYGLYLTVPTIFIGLITMIVMSAIQLTGLLTGNTDIIRVGTLGWVPLIYPLGPAVIFAMFFNRGRKNGGTVPGAADNLSACALAVAMCRFLVRNPSCIPENTEIRFISFGSEEAGLRGSRRYVAAHLDELKYLDAHLLNFETVAYPEIVISTSDVGGVKHSPDLVDSVVAAAERAGVPYKVKPSPTGGGGTDAGSFSQAGLKAVTLLPFKVPQQLVAFYHQKEDTPEILTIEPLLNVLKLTFEWICNSGGNKKTNMMKGEQAMDDKERAEKLFNGYRAEIRAKSPKSLEIWQKNRTIMPAGVGSLFRLADPFPMVVKRARGARVWDVDDNEYLDFMLGFSVMILGNTPDEVQEAIREALPSGTHYGQCHEHEYAFAKLFCDMVPGVEKVTFCNSGTEATMYAVRLARATTGRPLVAKFEGGYHGTHDLLAVSFGRPGPNAERCGPIEDPVAIPESPGFAEGAWKDTIVLPYNHPAAFEKIHRHASQLAAVIIEPVQGAAGAIPADGEFLSELRRITREIGAFLIFDEVITGFRLAPGGAQEYYRVRPDVSSYGKVAGGGFPFGAVGGTIAAMRLMEYDSEPGSILMAGTFNGNPMVTAAGTAVLQRLSSDPQLYARLNGMGDRFRSEINQFAQVEDFPAIATGAGSMFWMHTTRGPVTNVRDARQGHRFAGPGLRLLYRKSGIHIPPNHGFLCTAHTDEDIDQLVETHKAAMQELREQGVW